LLCHLNEENALDDLEKQLLTPAKLKNYAIRIGEDLYNRINRHVQLLKHLDNRSYSKQMWIREAIKERLKIEKGLTPEQLGKEFYLSFRVEEHLSEKITQSVQTIRKFRNSFSKKQWFLEAFYEKLVRDEQKGKKLLKKMRETSHLETKT
jgi:hypothetical protein